jgi:membrane-bound lytic murein transglycosylase D
MDFVSAEVERAGLPAEFVFIPLVESWYEPGAVGPGGPAGMWQMISSTARNHGIHIKSGYDGRLSPVESTRAALSYLKTLQEIFGNWQSIVMAYNAGEGRLQHAFANAGSRTASAADRRPHGLSNITYDYVAKLQALSCLIAEPSRQGLRLPSETRFEPLVPLLIGEEIYSLGEFARRNGKDADALRRLNPGFRNGRVVPGVPRLVLAPPGVSAPTALAAKDESSPEVGAGETMIAMSLVEPDSKKDSLPSRHKVRPGESLWTIARFYHLPIEQLRRANGLSKKALVHPGQMLRLAP